MNFSKLNSPYCYDTVISPRCFACSKDGKVIISAGHWDDTIKVTLTETGRTIDSISGNDDILFFSWYFLIFCSFLHLLFLTSFTHVVTAIAISEDGRVIVTGNRSSNLLSWKVNLTSDNEFLNVEHTPLRAFYGHDDEVSFIVMIYVFI